MTNLDIICFTFALLAVNLIVLITWTVLSPLHWQRIDKDNVDMYGRPTESYAVCRSDDGLPFAVTLIVVNVAFLIVGNWWAYTSRTIETDYDESSYIGTAMASTLQAWAMGIPILLVVMDKPPAKFYVMAGLIFITANIMLYLLYLPKMLALRKSQREEKNPNRVSYEGFTGRLRDVGSKSVQPSENKRTELSSSHFDTDQ